MAAAGATVIEPMDDLSVMGLAEGVKAIPAHFRLLRRLRERLASGSYDLAILVDYPGFHLKVAASAAANGVPVLYYIAPQLWAWGAWRIRSLRKHVRCLAVVLPFEEEYFRNLGIETVFVGHPLLDRASPPSITDARKSLELDSSGPVLGLFPGSRGSEIKVLWPAFRDAALLLRTSIPDLDVVVGAVDGCQYPGAEDWGITLGESQSALAAADVALCKSGTVTLEAAIADTPMVIAYKMHPITFAVARRAVRVREISLVNLIAGARVSPELLQTDVCPTKLADALRPLLDQDSPAAERQRQGFSEIRARLGHPGAASRVAELAERLIA